MGSDVTWCRRRHDDGSYDGFVPAMALKVYLTSMGPRRFRRLSSAYPSAAASHISREIDKQEAVVVAVEPAVGVLLISTTQILLVQPRTSPGN